MSVMKELVKGIWKENPVLVLMLGMCPTLAVSSSAKNALGMGIATTCVLAGSNLAISLVRKAIPSKVRIPCYIVIIAVFVTIVEMLMNAYAPAELNKTLGIYIPLIVVNCIVLGRAEAFASKNGVRSCSGLAVVPVVQIPCGRVHRAGGLPGHQQPPQDPQGGTRRHDLYAARTELRALPYLQ